MGTAALAFLILLHPALPAAQEDLQQQAAALISRAAELSNVRMPEGEPFVLRARVRLLENAAVSLVGSYTLMWSSPERWRRVIVIAEYTEVRIVNEDRTWGRSSLGYRGYQPVWSRNLTQALGFASRLKLRPDETVEKIRWRNENGTLMRCIEVKGTSKQNRELCFERVSGTLVRERRSNQLEVNEYTDYAAWGSKLFPRTLRVFEGDTLVVEVRVDELAAYPDPDPSWFEPPNGEEWWIFRLAADDIVLPKLIHHVLPEYTPQEATRKGIQGEVLIEAIVTTEGKVAEPILVQGVADDELNRRAMESVLQWRFEPGLKDGQPVPVIAEFTVTFRIH
jgi:TonB family protein